jgi:ubiquinone/menaquinone biosynthesis C-methylase UbiE
MPEPPRLLNNRDLLKHLALSPGMQVGDFGVGGTAVFAQAAAQRVGNSGGVIMFDVFKPALSAALGAVKTRGLENCRGVWSNLEIYKGASGVADNSLDAGLMVNLLNESKKYKDILAEVHRMIKSGGQLMIVDWQPETESPLAPPPARRRAQGHIAETAKSLGFAPLEKFAADDDHWGLVVVKT